MTIKVERHTATLISNALTISRRVSYGLFTPIALLFFVFVPACIQAQSPYGLVIHGGAGDRVHPDSLGPERTAIYQKALRQAVDLGYALLDEGKSAQEVVEAVIIVLEDNPLFNAGRGAVMNKNGEIFHDASIMLGQNRNAGAVAGVFLPKNPIQAAIAVMESTPHVFLSDKGAEIFIQSSGVPLMTDEDRAWYEQSAHEKRLSKKGTVGCVVLDQEGNLAAGTSTGGMSNKFPGRIGDSPVIGAGTWADNRTCAVSATGHGEYFIRSAAAYSVSAAMLYGDMDVHSATEFTINEIENIGGIGGLIAIDKDGNIDWSFNTTGMFRAARSSYLPNTTLIGISRGVIILN
jgi:L-asparaginase / beta-aspartyl-peptidase